ncbi:MAG: alpha/beta fold hydrolase [Oscillospiraceae bacterium]|nr:alpha/beta fold hydrolase [Oscillospiraceae bacterium]
MAYEIQHFSFLSSNKKDTIQGKMYLPSGREILGAVQVSHGMVEYFDRYEELCAFLAEKGFLVTGHDHLGHGATASCPEDLGFFGEKNGYVYLIQDLLLHTKFVKEAFPGLPHFLLGHSMGSFIARCYMAKYGGELSGVLLSGTGGPRPTSRAEIMAADAVCRTKGPRCRSAVLDHLAFGSFNRRFEGFTGCEWLSRDTEKVLAYSEDPLCTFKFTAAAFRDLCTLIYYANDPRGLRQVPRDLPVLFFSGDMDPVGNYGKGPAEAARALKKAGLFDVTCKLYPGGRHEMLNETCRAEVQEDLYRWLIHRV